MKLHKRAFFSGVLLPLIGLLPLFAGCKKEQPLERARQIARADTATREGGSGALRFFSEVTRSGGFSTRGSGWAANDEIGVYVLKHQAPLTAENLFGGYSNVCYYTPTGEGYFDNRDIGIELVKGEPVDFIAYAPYRSAVPGSFLLPLDMTDQRSQKALDLLYAKMADGVDGNTRVAQLRFRHVLAQVVLELEAEFDLTGATATIEGLQAKGTFNLADEKLTLSGEPTPISPVLQEISGKRAVFTAIMLPGQPISGMRLTIQVGGSSFTHSFTEASSLKSGQRYLYSLRLTGGATATQQGQGRFMEIPYPSSGELPSDAQLVTHMASGSLFGGGDQSKARRNYTILFSREKRCPYWVSYPLYPHCFGSQSRTDEWDYDPKIAGSAQPNLSSSYKTGGWTRGHMLASNHRTASYGLNASTFYYTNMVPQEGYQNSGPWNVLENKEKSWASNSTAYDTLYVVTGPIFEGATESTYDKDGKRIAVPSHTFKAFLRREKSTGQYHSIGVKMPNSSNAGSWQSHVVSVQSLEEELGFRFFTYLDPSVATVVKSNTSTAKWQ